MRLVFVYNVSSHPFNGLTGNFHKFLNLHTQGCKLCAFTQTAFSERKAWKVFRENASIPMKFLHSNEWFTQKHTKYHYEDLPLIVLEREKGNSELFMAASEINAIRSVDDFIAEVKARLANG